MLTDLSGKDGQATVVLPFLMQPISFSLELRLYLGYVERHIAALKGILPSGLPSLQNSLELALNSLK